MLCVALYRLYVASYMMYVASYMLYVASYILTLHCLWCPWYDVRLRQAPRRRSFSAGSASSRACLSTRQGTARCDERAHTRICTHICALSAADSLWHAHTAGRLYSCAHMRSGSFSTTADITAVAFHWLHCCAIWQTAVPSLLRPWLQLSCAERSGTAAVTRSQVYCQTLNGATLLCAQNGC